MVGVGRAAGESGFSTPTGRSGWISTERYSSRNGFSLVSITPPLTQDDRETERQVGEGEERPSFEISPLDGLFGLVWLLGDTRTEEDSGVTPTLRSFAMDSVDRNPAEMLRAPRGQGSEPDEWANP